MTGRRGLSPSEQRRARLLVVSKRRATGLLVAVAAVFVVSSVLGSGRPWLGWVQAAAAAAVVGGLADWFAVTALFRRPLGLPIPHTAIVVERKDRFGETLGAFVQESFLSPEAVGERLRASRALARVAAWAAQPENASAVAGQVAAAVVSALDAVDDDDVQQLLVALGRERLERVPLAPTAGRALRYLTAGRRHEPLVDAALAAALHGLETQGPDLRRRLGMRSPWWLPGPLEQRMVDRTVGHLHDVVAAMAADRAHPLRAQLDVALADLADRLERSEALYARGEELKAELLGQPELRAFVGAAWADARRELTRQATDAGSTLRSRLADAVAAGATRLRDDDELRGAAERAVDRGTRAVLDRFDAELARLVSATVAHWDAAETSRRLELLLGPDLQYIRINGCVVGAAAGLVLHGVGRLLG